MELHVPWHGMSFLRTLFTLRSFSSTYNGCVLVIGMHSNLAQLVQRLAITLVPIFLVPPFLSTTKCCWLSKRRKRRLKSREFKSLGSVAERSRELDIFKNQTSNVIFLFRIVSLLSATKSSSLRSYRKFATTVYTYLKKKTKQNKKKKKKRDREKNDARIASCAARLFCWDPNRRTRVAIQFQRLLLSPERPPRQKQPRVWHTWFTCELVTASGGSVYVDKTRMYTHGTASSRPLVAFVRGREGVSRCRMFWRGSWRNCKEKTEGKKKSLRFFAFLSLSYPFALSLPVFVGPCL